MARRLRSADNAKRRTGAYSGSSSVSSPYQRSSLYLAFASLAAFRSRQETVDFSPDWLDLSLDGFPLSIHARSTPRMQVRYLEPDRYTVEISGRMEFVYPENVWYQISATGQAEALSPSWETEAREQRQIDFDYTFRLLLPREQGE